MRFLIRTGTLVLQLAAFFVLLALLSQATTYFTAERYAAGDNASLLFPLVAVQPAAAPAATPRYELLRWRQFTRKDPPPLIRDMRLPQLQGEFVVPVAGGYAPHVRFTAAGVADGRQRVEVKVTDDDYVLYAVYVTDGAKVVPESLRIWGPSSVLLAVFPAFVLTFVLTRLVRRRLKRAKPSQSG